MSTPPAAMPRHIRVIDDTSASRSEIDIITDWLSRLDQRVDSMAEQTRVVVQEAVQEAVAANSARQLTAEQCRWVELAIQREAQSIRLRQAIIEKSLAGLVWAAIVGLGAIVYEWLQAHGWRP